MGEYDICTNAIEIIAGTDNRTSPVYVEASKSISDDSSKSLKYLKNFLISIEELQSKDIVKDQRISASKGDIESFNGYDNIKKGLEFVNKYASGTKDAKHISVIMKGLSDYKTQYKDGYTHNISLVKSEYECAVYLVVTGLVAIMCTNTDVVANGNGLKVVKKSGSTGGTISKILSDFALQISTASHKQYLEYMIKSKLDNGVSTNVNESMAFTEGAVLDTLKLVSNLWDVGKNVGKVGFHALKMIKNSVFGIVPLIRSVLYLRYKRKADTVLELDKRIEFIQQNIERLEKRTNISEKEKQSIIKKQQAYIETYRKKAEKLRAELMETEKEAAAEIKKENPTINTTPDDDGDFVLEGVDLGIFNESGKNKYQEAEMPEDIKKRYDAYDDIEKKLKVKIPSSIKLAYALKQADIFYNRGKRDISVDIIFPNQMEEEYKLINDSITDKASEEYLPVVPISRVGNGDMDVITKKGKIMYYHHDTKTPITSNGKCDDPEKFYFVDSPNAKYDKKRNMTIYIDHDNSNGKSKSPLN